MPEPALETSRTPRFENAVALSTKFPNAFRAPSMDGLRAVRPGVHIKVSEAEGMWLKVTEVHEGESETELSFVGVVAHHLTRTDVHGLSLGDAVRVSYRHVYAIHEDPAA